MNKKIQYNLQKIASILFFLNFIWKHKKYVRGVILIFSASGHTILFAGDSNILNFTNSTEFAADIRGCGTISDGDGHRTKI